MCKTLFIAATGQSDGKTTTSIGLYHCLRQQNMNVGFIKPVGQQYVLVNDQQVDKDSYLIETIFQSMIDIKLTSPIAIPSGYTERYIENRQEMKGVLRADLLESYKRVSQGKDFMIVEGTGHAGVGSVLDLSNAFVAKMLGAKVILLVPGGIGNTIDEVMLNKALFDQEGVEVLGVIVNKVLESKYEKIKSILTRGFANYGIHVLGFMPFKEELSSPNMFLLKEALKADVLNEGAYQFTNIRDVVVGAMTPHYVMSYLKKDSLLITPGDREDVLLAALALSMLTPDNQLAGIILTGGILPRGNVTSLLLKSSIPIFHVSLDTYETAKKVSHLDVKITVNDKKKITTAKQLIEDYIDKDYISSHL